MAIAVGDLVGSFTIVSLLGRGAMGEVFRAHDRRLGRDVALKFLSIDWASDPEARARFEREARAIAALTHPNIGALHDVGEHAGSPYLVMECVDGETLASRLQQGPRPLAETLRVGEAVAAALAYAHRRGIVHRDLKPGNIMLTKTGVKLLDFGLAKIQRDRAADDTTAMRTEPHRVMGTLPYMSPEQVSGEDVDARTDIFAFGVTLFEMISGRRPFVGDSQARLTGAILRDDPPRLEPDWLDVIVRRCLTKDRDERWQSIQDVGVLLTQAPAPVAAAPAGSRRATMLLAVAAAMIVFAVLVWPGGVWRSGASPATARRAHASITLQKNQQFVVTSRPSLAISPDGAVVAFIARYEGVNQLLIRRMGQPHATVLPGTANPISLFFSPDGQWIGFQQGTSLRKVAVTGGPAVHLANVTELHGAAWTVAGDIVYAPAEGGPLWIVPSMGGAPRQLTTLDAVETSHRWPFALPGGRIGFSASSSAAAHIDRFDPRSGARDRVIVNASWAQRLSSGRWLFSRGFQLFTVSGAADDMPGTDPPEPVAEIPLMNGTGVPFMAVADSGDMIFLPAEVDETQRLLVWVDRSGREVSLPAPPRPYLFPRISPDGRLVAVSVGQGAEFNAWVYDIARDALTPLTNDGQSAGSFAWSPDGSELALSSSVGGPRNLRRLRIDAPGSAEPVLSGPRSQWPGTWLPNGRLTFMQFSPDSLGDVLMVNLADRQVTALVAGPGTQWGGRVSADGQWLAYVSNESGRFEAMVAPMSNPQRRWQVSQSGGSEVAWSRDGLELYFRTDSGVMAAIIDPRADLPLREVRTLFERQYFYQPSAPGLANYDVGADGRFLMIKSGIDTLVLRVVFNWSGAPSATTSR